MSKWVQDGGHGGIDGGASHNGFLEKKYTLEASMYVNKRLNELGISSDVTRDKDVSLPNNPRTNKVKKFDKCISHHFNAGGGVGAEFIHSLHANGNFEKLLVDEFKKAGYQLRSKPIYTRKYPNTNNTDYYFMHRETGKCRTTIVEYDFVDGKNNSKLKNKDYRVGMYECVVKAICRDEKIKYVPPNTKTEDSDNSTYFRVVAGSYKDRKNAENQQKKLKEKGFDSFLVAYKE